MMPVLLAPAVQPELVARFAEILPELELFLTLVQLIRLGLQGPIADYEVAELGPGVIEHQH